MICIECGSNTIDDNFSFCIISMCTMPVCSDCAVIHALKETFQKYPLSNKKQNEFFNKVLTDYKILLGDKN